MTTQSVQNFIKIHQSNIIKDFDIMRLILLGPPGAGKGTQALSIAKEFNIPHISTGNILRANIKQGTELGLKAKSIMDSGLLVPDNLVMEIVEDRLKQDDCKRGFLLDGFPRTIVQAESLDNILEKLNISLNFAISIQVDTSVLVERAVGRRICKECGATYHTIFNPSKGGDVCELCSGKLYQRPDDNEKTVSKRIEVYISETAPLIGYYQQQGILVTIDGHQSISKVFEGIAKLLRRN